MEQQTQATGQDLHELFRSVFQLQAVLAQGLDVVHENSGMSTPWKRVLHELDSAGNAGKTGALTVPDIAARLHLSRQFILKTCNDMEAAGLVDYADNPRHKRSRLVCMTRQGREAFAMTMANEQALIARMLPGVNGLAAREAAALLNELRGRMQEVGLEGLLPA